MRKKLKAVFAFLLALVLTVPMNFTSVLADDGANDAAVAEEPAVAKAFLMFASSDWGTSKWAADDTDVVINEAGTYTVSYTSEAGFDGFAFAALGIENGETLFPGATIKIQSIKINGSEIEVSKGYTSSDDGIVTRMNLYNEWVTDIPADARSYDGVISDSTPFCIANDIKGIKSIEITFDYYIPTAYIMFADSNWSTQYWYDGNEYAGVHPENVAITGPGQYTVKMTTDSTFDSFAFLALGISYGDIAFPAGCIELNSVKINGVEQETKLGYTSSDDGITTRMNIYNEWVSSVPEDARGYGDITEASAQIIGKDHAGTNEIEITFTYHIPYAYLMYSVGGWAASYWGNYANDVQVDGEGKYTVSFDFGEGVTYDNFDFLAIGIQDAEKIFPGYTIKIESVKLNGENYELTGKPYTSSDDGITTRMNLYNEWVSFIPKDARSYDGVVDDCTWISIPKETTGINKMEVTFTYVAAEKEYVEEVDTFDYEGAMKQTYNAYMAVQTSPNYVFRNEWFETSYGKNAEGDYFSHLTGWDADNNATNNGGVFTDTVINGDGTYSVRLDLAEGDAGFANQESYNFIKVATDIPYKLYEKGYINITDVKTSFDGGKGREFTYINSTTDGTTKTDYLELTILNTYDSEVGSEAIPYVMATKSIVITFTVTGFGTTAEPTPEPTATPAPTEAPAATATPVPTEAPIATATPAPTEAPATSSSSNAGSVVVIVIVALAIAAACVYFFVIKKNKK